MKRNDIIPKSPRIESNYFKGAFMLWRNYRMGTIGIDQLDQRLNN